MSEHRAGETMQSSAVTHTFLSFCRHEAEIRFTCSLLSWHIYTHTAFKHTRLAVHCLPCALLARGLVLAEMHPAQWVTLCNI